jgi:hypothetical protein
MSIGTITDTNLALEWVQKNQNQIEVHPAWHSNISEDESEQLLKDKSPFTYLLRLGEQERLYFISFVNESGSINHQFFVLEFDRKGWLYRNAGTGGPQGTISKNLDWLIPKIMHCDFFACTPLKKSLR